MFGPHCTGGERVGCGGQVGRGGPTAIPGVQSTRQAAGTGHAILIHVSLCDWMQRDIPRHRCTTPAFWWHDAYRLLCGCVVQRKREAAAQIQGLMRVRVAKGHRARLTQQKGKQQADRLAQQKSIQQVGQDGGAGTRLKLTCHAIYVCVHRPWSDGCVPGGVSRQEEAKEEAVFRRSFTVGRYSW